MRSDLMKSGVDRIPHRALFRAGPHRRGTESPIIGVVSAKNEIIPGHMHLDKISEAVKARHPYGRWHSYRVPRHRRVRRHCHEPRGHVLLFA